MIMMAIDFGLSRTGLAICDEQELMPRPLGTIKEKNYNSLCLKIAEKVKKDNVRLVIIGFPKNMDGSEGESAKRSIKLKNDLKNHLNIDVVLWDERKTTSMANVYLNVTNVRGKKRKDIIDSVSATIMLEEYINFKKSRDRIENESTK